MSEKNGRPRDMNIKYKVLSVTYKMLVDRGFQAITMEKIATESGSSKATLYRWWPSKSAILLEAVQERADSYPTFDDTGDVRKDLLSEIQGVITYYNGTTGKAMLDLIAHSRFEQELGEVIRDHFINKWREATTKILGLGISRKQLRPDLQFDLFMDSVWGAIYYRLLVYKMPMPSEYAKSLLDMIWPTIALQESIKKHGE